MVAIPQPWHRENRKEKKEIKKIPIFFKKTKATIQEKSHKY